MVHSSSNSMSVAEGGNEDHSLHAAGSRTDRLGSILRGRGKWARFFAQRALRLCVVVAGLVVVTFFMVRLVPGDPVLNITGIGASAATKAQVTHELGLDQTVPQQFIHYAGGLLHGSLGSSFEGATSTGVPVSTLIAAGIGPTFQLAAVAFVVVILLGLPTGMLAAVLTAENRRPGVDGIFTGLTTLVAAVPEYLTATFLAAVFAVFLRLLPVAGTSGPQSLILPVAAISLRPIAVLAKIVRAQSLNVLGQDYIRNAHSKRIPERLILLKHVTPNVFSSALTVSGVLFTGLIGGTILVENVFNRSGLGTLLVNAVLQKDYPLVQGVVLVLGIAVVVINTVIDTIVAIVDPRSLVTEG